MNLRQQPELLRLDPSGRECLDSATKKRRPGTGPPLAGAGT
jgi:hypothetical protein